MSIHAMSKDAKDTIDRVMSTALSCDVNSAIAVVQQSELTQDQKAKITGILQEPRSDHEEQTIAALQQRIVAVVDNIASAATPKEQPSSSQVSQVITSDQIGLPSDIIELLLNRYFSGCDFETLSAVRCVNKHWNECSTNFWNKRDVNDIKKLCPGLRILDAKAQGIQCKDEPKISTIQLFKWVSKISPHVEGNAGVTQLTMVKGTTLNQLVAIAEGLGMQVDFQWDRIIPVLGDVPIRQSYVILITNSVFVNSREKCYTLQKKLVQGHGCLMPTVQEYVALCVYTDKVFHDFLYGNSNPRTLARSSTQVDHNPLVVGDSAPGVLNVGYRGNFFYSEECGAGGKRKI